MNESAMEGMQFDSEQRNKNDSNDDHNHKDKNDNSYENNKDGNATEIFNEN